MKKLQVTIFKFANHNMLRLMWVALIVTALILGSGAPVAFGGGSGGGG
jgi:hypothetical protein